VPYRSYGAKKKDEYKRRKLLSELGIYSVIVALIGTFILVISR